MGIAAEGLGGGGDVGLASMLTASMRIHNPVIVGFSRCNSSRLSEHRVVGSLISPRCYHPRNLESSLLPYIPCAEVYTICTRDS